MRLKNQNTCSFQRQPVRKKNIRANSKWIFKEEFYITDANKNVPGFKKPKTVLGSVAHLIVSSRTFFSTVTQLP